MWEHQPPRPVTKAFQHDLKYTGRSVKNKIAQIQSLLKSKKCDYYILTTLDSIAWLLNLRGNDVLYTPLNLAYVLITPNKKVELFFNEKNHSGRG